MAWGIPHAYDPAQYNMAGRVLVHGSSPSMSTDMALEIINNWRSAHYHPLNTFQWRLRRKAQEVDGNSLVVQRIKRLHSIRHKLARFQTMRLAQIQDIGGCRAIVSTLDHLQKLADIMANRDENRSGRGLKHKLIDEKDYIKYPKSSGYRGIHLVFKYHSDKAQDFNGLKIEIQLRTYMQHAWATAVETVGIFIGQALKSSIGQEDWLQFFALASSAMAAYEGSEPVPGVDLTPDQLRSALRGYYTSLDVEGHLKAYNLAIESLDQNEKRGSHFYLLELNTEKRSVTVISYNKNQLEKAAADYLAIETNLNNTNVDAVLVSADSLNSLKKAYPNYFIDTVAFIDFLKRIIA